MLKFTVEQYDRMIDAGVFAQLPAGEDAGVDEPRVELLDGEIASATPVHGALRAAFFSRRTTST